MANTAGTSADNPLVIPEEGLLWDGNGSTVLKGVNSEWYKTNVTDAGVQFVAIKIPEKTSFSLFWKNLDTYFPPLCPHNGKQIRL